MTEKEITTDELIEKLSTFTASHMIGDSGPLCSVHQDVLRTVAQHLRKQKEEIERSKHSLLVAGQGNLDMESHLKAHKGCLEEVEKRDKCLGEVEKHLIKIRDGYNASISWRNSYDALYKIQKLRNDCGDCEGSE